MPISFHCESCKQKIKAPDETGGKWGRCPHCGHKCYIPLPPRTDDEPELRLIPLDENEETQIDELMRETKNLTQEILSQSALPDDETERGGSRTVQEKEIIKQCILYLRQMADGELAAAEYTFLELRKNKKPVLRVLASMARSEQPEPELSDLPPRILQGLIRDVADKMK